MRDGAVNLVVSNAQATIEQYKTGLEIQKFLMTYRVGSFNMVFDDMRRYLTTKHPSIDKSFLDVVQKDFIEGEELDFTLVELTNTMSTSITPLAELPPTVIPPSDLPPANVLAKPIVLPPVDQIKDVAPTDVKPSSTKTSIFFLYLKLFVYIYRFVEKIDEYLRSIIVYIFILNLALTSFLLPFLYIICFIPLCLVEMLLMLALLCFILLIEVVTFVSFYKSTFSFFVCLLLY